MKTIEIPESALKKAAAEGMDEFIAVFIDKYLEAISGELNEKTMPLLNGHQHTLLGYHFFREEVMNGGFIQLIQNGYGGYIFENPFAKAMRMFGANEFAKLLYKAKEIYDKNKEDLTRERSDEDFMAMYEQYESFDDLEDSYIEMEEEVTETIARYVDEHINLFAEIIKD